jgi:hypothetical protein
VRFGMGYREIAYLEYETSCVGITQERWDELMKDSKRANKREVNKLVKDKIPSLYDGIQLKYFNPYNYFKTKTHLILVHSAVEHFLKIN